MEKDSITGKRILITHTLIDNIQGSTVVTLELASCLKSLGADVEVCTSLWRTDALVI